LSPLSLSIGTYLVTRWLPLSESVQHLRGCSWGSCPFAEVDNSVATRLEL
jgi:hypothetical protein